MTKSPATAEDSQSENLNYIQEADEYSQEEQIRIDPTRAKEPTLTEELSYKQFFTRLLKFMGPGFLVSVGYLDPGNWATDLSAGSQFGYRLLFIIFLSNLMAMLLQSMCVKLGVVTGLDLAQSCRKYFPKYVSLVLYVLCEIAIMATDLAEVIGSAIALNLLFNIPLVYGVLITGLDVLVIMAFGFNAKHMRYFEFGIAGLVFATACCLFVVMARSDPSWGQVALGFLPSVEIVTEPKQLYTAVGIIGATVMPHNLYLHSSIVKYRAQHDDGEIIDIDMDGETLIPDTQTLQRKMILPTVIRMSIIDSVFALTFALFVNASILIVSSANFHSIGRTDVAEIEDAFHLIGDFLGMGFAYTFAVALLFAGQSSTITGTMAGQIVMEGFLGSTFNIKPWVRRIVTRLFAMVPALVCISIYGGTGLNNLLILSQIILSLQLPFAVWPLIWFSSRRDIMEISFMDEHDNLISPNVPTAREGLLESSVRGMTRVNYSNSKVVIVLACIVGVMLTIFNGILLVQVIIGEGD